MSFKIPGLLLMLFVLDGAADHPARADAARGGQPTRYLPQCPELLPAVYRPLDKNLETRQHSFRACGSFSPKG